MKPHMDNKIMATKSVCQELETLSENRAAL